MKRTSLLIFTLLLVFFNSASIQAESTSNELNWVGCGITKKAFMDELAKAYEKKTGIHINIDGGGATKGIRAVAAGTADIGGSCRSVLNALPEERDAKQTPVAWDALVIIVNNKNKVKNLALEQLKAIYLGKIKNWREVGGADAPIELYVRQGKLSGVGRMLRELVFGNYEQEFVATHVVDSSGPLEKEIEDNVNAIGVTGVSSAIRRNLKILSLDGVEPSYENIKAAKYSLYRPLYLISNRNNTNPFIDEFINFALSREGQEIIKKAGSIPYSEAMALIMYQIERDQQVNREGITGEGQWNPNLQQ
ncbi:MAG: phosphate ABC transporter substrate-binding protein [Gammaproteobacteria bacterium]|nr:phosphate ABC transporter substrate-binding protein [Gammaproteobacteria bacterium]